MLKPVFTLSIWLITLIALGQSVTPEEYHSYLEKPAPYIVEVRKALAEFDQFALKKDVPAMKEKVNELRQTVKALQAYLNAMKPLRNEKWYLPALKNLAVVYSESVEKTLPSVIGYMERGEVDNAKLSFHVMENKLEKAFDALEIAQYTLAGKLSYDETSEYYCSLVKSLEGAALTNFNGLKGQLKDGTENQYHLNTLPEGIQGGSINVNKDDTRAVFTLHTANTFDEAMSVLIHLAQIFLACDGNDHLVPWKTKVTPSDLAIGFAPQIHFKEKDKSKTKHRYRVQIFKIDNNGNQTFEIALIMTSEY